MEGNFLEKKTNKEKEKWAVLNFYKNQGIEIDICDLKFDVENSPTDIIFKSNLFLIRHFYY